MSKEKIWWMPYGIAMIALFIGTFFDYQIDAYVYHPDYLFGIIFQRYILCFFIAFLTFIFAMLQRLHHRSIFILFEVITAVYAVAEVAKYHISLRDHIIMILLISIGIIALANMIIYRMNMARLRMLEKKGIFFACVLLTAIFMTFIIKNLWGRIRFRELQSIAQFTPWYLPQGFTGHFSFPSGHVTSASSILCLLVTTKQCERQKTPWYIVVFVYGFILCMAVSRLLMGAHYLSDVAIGFMITYTVFLCYRHHFYRKRYL